MLVVAVLYPASDGATFDHDYYMSTHIPLVNRLWGGMGLEDVRVLRGVPGPDKAPPTYLVMALLTFSSIDAFKAGTRAHGKEIFDDIPKFTNVAAVVQLNEPMG